MSSIPQPASQPRLLSGTPIAARIRAEVKRDVAAFRRRHGYAPSLAVVLIGGDAPSAVYLQQILKTCRSVGIEGRLVEIPGRDSNARIRRRLTELNEDPLVSGIIVQQPLPKRIPLATVIETLDPAKDLDGIHPLNAGLLSLGYDGFLPATAQASVEILKRSEVPLAGRHVVIVGRSNVVGKPAALLLLREDATVSVVHSKTRDVAAMTRSGEIVVVAAGRPNFITGEMLRPGATVDDVDPDVDGRLVGDVDFDTAKAVVEAITPVPGGVGPVTNAILMRNVVRAAKAQAEATTHHLRPLAVVR